MSRSSLAKDRLDGPDDERQGHEQQREDERRVAVYATLTLEIGALRPVRCEQRQAGDDRGCSSVERQVDQRRVRRGLAAERVADEHPGDDGSGDRVDQHDDDEDAEGQLQRGDRLADPDRVPECAHPPSSERSVSAASGIRTMTLRYAVETPRAAELRGAAWVQGLRRYSRAAPDLPLDPGRDPVLAVEELLLHLGQPPTSAIVKSPGAVELELGYSASFTGW